MISESSWIFCRNFEYYEEINKKKLNKIYTRVAMLAIIYSYLLNWPKKIINFHQLALKMASNSSCDWLTSKLTAYQVKLRFRFCFHWVRTIGYKRLWSMWERYLTSFGGCYSRKLFLMYVYFAVQGRHWFYKELESSSKIEERKLLNYYYFNFCCKLLFCN